MFFAAAFLIFCVVCTVLAFSRHPIYGLYFYLSATYVFPPGRWWGYLFGETRWSLIAAGVTVLAVVFHRGKLQPKPVWLANVPAMVFAMYVAWMLIQFPFALDWDTHYRGVTLLVKYLVAFWFVYRIIDTKDRVRDLLLAHVLGCGFLGILAYVSGRTMGDRLDGVGGPGIDDANTLGMYFATGVLAGIGLVLTQNGWRRWLSLTCVAIIMEGLVLVNTRGAFLGLLAGGLVLTVVKAKAHRRLFWALAIVGLIGVATIVDHKFLERMWSIENVGTESLDTSAQSRIAIVQAQWRMFLDYPWGSGHRGTEILSANYIDREWLTLNAAGQAVRSSHNTFMTTLVEQGMPGAMLFVWLVLWTLLAVFRLRQLAPYHADASLTTLGAAIFSALTAIFVSGNTADFLLAEVQFWLFAILASTLQLVAAPRPEKPSGSNTTGVKQRDY